MSNINNNFNQDSIVDVQNSPDLRALPINKTGIKAIRHPILVKDGKLQQHSIGVFNLYVDLPGDIKGTHMSRFVELLNREPTIIAINSISTLLQTMQIYLSSNSSFIEVSFPFFLQKYAPVSKAAALLDYEITLSGSYVNNKTKLTLSVVVPVTSLCPCSKQISKYGAHNQRSQITITANVTNEIYIQELIILAEEAASCELYGVLKRADEKYVTEKAYDNPKFVEDLVRDIAIKLDENNNVLSYTVASENFESIHNHSAFAQISKDKINNH